MQEAHIRIRAFQIMVFLYTIGSSILIIPSSLATAARQDAWVSALAGTFIGTALAWMYGRLGCRMAGRSPVQYCLDQWGPYIGRAAALWYVLFALLLSSLVLRNLGDFMVTEVLPETPLPSIHVLVLCIVIMAIRLGLDCFIRAAEIFFPWVLLLGMMLIVLLLSEIELHHLQPFIEADTGEILRGASTFVGTPFLELVLLLSIFPAASGGGTRAFVLGSFTAGIALTLICLLAILVMGPDLTARQLYPTFVLAKKISIGHFLERLEIIVGVLWNLTLFFKMTICCYAGIQGLSQLLGLSESKALTLPVGMILLTLSIIAYPSTPYYFSFVTTVWLPYTMSVGLLLPVLLLLTAALRSAAGGRHVED